MSTSTVPNTHPNYAAGVAVNVAAAMRAKHVGQLALADKAGIPQATLVRRLTGTSPFTVDELDRIAGALDVDVVGLATVGPLDTGATVLDENLNLTVRTEDDLVVMTADPAPDGTWQFTATEARDLAAALVDHARRAERIA